MPFSEAGITLLPPVPRGAELKISWTSTLPAGTIYQCYIDQVLVYANTNLFTVIPLPGDTIQIDVGSVGPTEKNTNFSDLLPSPPATKAELTWLGGTFMDANISGFFVFASDEPGGAVDFTTPVATIPAYTGTPTDGFGLGGFGDGGFGEAAASYSFESGTLASGVWQFAVAGFDAAGNIGTTTTTSVTINAPPLPPAPNASNQRLTFTFNASTEEATLNWLASPSA
jgi:hypothetical protein